MAILDGMYAYDPKDLEMRIAYWVTVSHYCITPIYITLHPTYSSSDASNIVFTSTIVTVQEASHYNVGCCIQQIVG